MAFRVAGSFRYASPMVTNSSQVPHIGLGVGFGLLVQKSNDGLLLFPKPAKRLTELILIEFLS